MRDGRLWVAGGAVLALWCLACPRLAAQDPELAGEIFVDLDASDESAGTEVWLSQGSMIEFVEMGDPIVTDVEGAPGVTFNSTGLTQDAYQSAEDVPPGLVEPNTDRTIEVWAHNPDIVAEETMVTWGWRGGPLGTNMSFLYGTNVFFSAVGHWGGEFPDIGWGAIPPANQWHHLVYTYDGNTTRVYQDGHISNIEYLGTEGTGAIQRGVDTHDPTKMALAVQYTNGALAPDWGVRQGTLSLGKIRIHDGTLSSEQIMHNYLLERPRFPLPPEPASILNAPEEDFIVTGRGPYQFQIKAGGFPVPALEVVEPAGAQISPLQLLTYALPNPEPASFTVTIRATNENGPPTEAIWTVHVLKVDTLQVAGELFVELDGRNASAGTPLWENTGTLGDFEELGDPVLVTLDGAPAVSFNEGSTSDAYQQATGDNGLNTAPDGLIGPDPTRSIEVWALNVSAGDEEGMVSWGMRGGPDGTNMSFNYGAHVQFGAVTHWGGSHQDLSWQPNAPPVGQWNHLAYTFDGQNTRIYRNGQLAAWEGLGPGQINTHVGTRITLGAQVSALMEPDFGGTQGSLSLGRVRIHDGVLAPAQVLNNYLLERPSFPLPPTASFTATPEQGTEPLEVALDARGSTSPNGVISRFQWDFGDTQTAEGATVVHRFERSGHYLVTLTVTDARGGDASLQKPVDVHYRSGDVSPWQLADISDTAVLVRGGARQAPGACLQVHAGGKDIGRTADSFHFVHRPFKGDASLIARVDSAQLPANAKVGVMLREDNSPGARNACTLLVNSAVTRYSFYRRETKNGPTRPPRNSVEPFNLPNAWVRIQRTGVELISSWSADGVAWTELGRVTLPTALPDEILGGIAATAADLGDAYLALDAVVCDIQTVGAVEQPIGPTFRRGNVNGDSLLDISDAIGILGYLFLGQADKVVCVDAADIKDKGSIDISDAISVLNFLFQGGAPPAAPGPETCGQDVGQESPDLGCAQGC